jgi:hypothetical protein
LFLWWQGRGSAGNNGRLAWGVAALALVALLFLPLARSAWLVSGDESLPGRAFAGMNSALRDLLPVYTLGWPAWLARYGTWVLIGSGVLALAGLVLPDRLLAGGGQGIGRASAQAAPRWGGLYLATWLALPLLLGGLLLARDRTVFAETRYFIFLVPALCLAWGRALAAAWSWRRPVGALALVLVLAVTLSGLRADWTPPQRREAWREAAAYVQAHAGPRDAILIYPDYVRVAFERYFDGPQPVFAPFTDAIGDRSSIDGPLEGLAGYDAVWLVESHQQDLDPGNLIPGWFAARYPLITEQYPAGVALRGYATRYRSRQGPEPTLDVRLGDLRLLACQADPGPIRAQDDLYHPPSGWVHVTTYWTADEPIQADLFPTVQMIDELGQVWGDRLERSNDAIHLWPTSRWLPGEMVRVDYDVNLNPVTPPGRYRIVVGLPGVDGPFQCGTVEVE